MWAFGCVLFECLTAKRAFVGETLTDVLGAVLHATADMDALPRDTPRRVRALIESCFVKDPRRRLRDIGQARVELERCLAEGGADDARADDGGARDSALGGRASTDARRRASGSWLALGALVMAALGAALWSTFAPQPESSDDLTCVSVVTPPETVFLGMQLTSDERTLVGFGRPRTPTGAVDAPTRAYVRRMDGFEFEALAGTEGYEAGVPTRDGRGLLFIVSDGPGSTERRLAYVPLDGSAPPTTVAVWQQYWISFVELESGDIVVADGPMSCTRLDRATGKLDLSVRLDAGRSEVQRFELQEALPDDRGVLVNVVSYGERGFQFGVGVLDPATGRVDVIVEDGGNARWSPTGHLLFARGATILAAPFDMAERRVRGAPVAVWGGALSNNRAFPATFQVTASGTLAFPPAWGEFAHELALLHEDGRVEAWSKERLDLGGPLSVSPDGRRVLVQRLNVRGIDEFLVSDTDEPNFEKLGTETNADSFFGTWSPDGRRVAYFRSGRDGRDGVYVRDVASGEQTLVFSVTEAEVEGAFVTGWLADASALLVTQFVGYSARVVLVPLEGAADDRSRLKQLLPDDFIRRLARPSRDGRFVAYQSDETGALHTFVAPLASDGTIGRAVRVRTNGSKWHAWGHARPGDGATLYVQDSIDRLQKVSVTTVPELSLGEPVEIANLGALRVDHWDVLSEGTFLVGAKHEGAGEVRRFDLVFGWAGQLDGMVEAVR